MTNNEILEKAKETIRETKIPGLLVIQRPTFADERGFFRETFRKNELEAVVGREITFVQQNHARNLQKGTLRGIHIAPWDKFIYVPRGLVQAILVDLRPNSPAFGKYESIVIGEDCRAKVFVPAGLGNAYNVLSDVADYMYDTTDYWYAGAEKYVAWDDPDLAIAWQLDGEPIVSDKDKDNPSVREVFHEKFSK